MGKHTPGPWEIIPHEHALVVRMESDEKTKFGAVRYASIGDFDRSSQKQLSEAIANANLIAAAPELLEALEQTQILLERLGIQSSDEYQANAAAIAKAKGEK